ncbi:MAG: iron ABC transporter permease [Sphaerochaetaceae bacterium]|jgi:iron(III) transport system permease protein|nr:iron ABC transporter permease [Sphaerochaetaceae bacterium]NLO59925.1 iron ABC transporter permease [Spirochaetales bacterium]MDD2405437.1 iron ABC transporter permease [Sphaerochaetaceae bacterium]MDD4259422.1 iron ABC transporter permease [Sphaerochaetaceae bacterium]MDD4763174.1 iron ABC transporter permease [Sphaerochaetaceae bacterium]
MKQHDSIREDSSKTLRQFLKKDFTPYMVFAIPLAFMAIFLIYPMITTILRAFMPAGNKLVLGQFSLEGFTKFFESSMYRKALLNSFVVSFAVTAFSLVIGVPMGYFVARVKLPAKNLMLSLGILPIIMPSFVGAFTWVILLGRNGVLRHFLNVMLGPLGIEVPTIYGMFGMILCMTLTYYPFVFQLSYGAFASANALLEEAGMLMGASKWRIFRTVTFPLILPSLGASALLVFVRAIGNFGIPAVIGGDKYVLPTLIYFRVNGFWDLNGAASIAIVNVLITAIVLWLQKYVISRREYETISATHSEIKLHEGKGIRIIAFVYCIIILVMSLLPQLTIIIMSFSTRWVGLFPEGFTLKNYLRIPSYSSKELFNTFYLSLLATFLAALLGSLIAYITERKKPKGAALLDMSVMAPFILPGTVVSVALLSAFSGNSIIKLTGTYAIIVISYMVRRTPYVYRSVAASLSQLNPSLEEASTIAGANWLYTFRRVSVPLILPSIISGSILTLTTLLQELSTTILLYSSKTRTVPIQIYGAVADGKLGEASALSVVLLLVVFGIIYILNKSQGKSISSSFKMG